MNCFRNRIEQAAKKGLSEEFIIKVFPCYS